MARKRRATPKKTASPAAARTKSNAKATSGSASKRGGSGSSSSSSSESGGLITAVLAAIVLAVIVAALHFSETPSLSAQTQDGSAAAGRVAEEPRHQQRQHQLKGEHAASKTKSRNGNNRDAASCRYPEDSEDSAAAAASRLDDKRPVAVHFVNPHDVALQVLWVDYDGHEQPQGRVEAHAEASFKTFAGNVWRLRRPRRSVSTRKAPSVVSLKDEPPLLVDEIRVDHDPGGGGLTNGALHYKIRNCNDDGGGGGGRRTDEDAEMEDGDAAAVQFASQPAAFGRSELGRVSDSAVKRKVARFLGAGCGAVHGGNASAAGAHVREWVSRYTVPGYHVLCLRPVDSGSVVMFGLQNGVTMTPKYVLRSDSDSERDDEFRRRVEEMLPMSRTDANVEAARRKFARYAPQNWAAFDTGGRRLQSYRDVLQDGRDHMLLVFEGGQFVWPGIDVGFKRDIVVPGDKRLTLETLSLRPVVLSVAGFLEDGECDHIISTAKPFVKASEVKLMDKDKGKAAKEFRTSSTHFLNSRYYKFLRPIDERVANLTRTPLESQEDAQVLRYLEGQYYLSHHDFFDPVAYRNGEMFNNINAGHLNRLLTVFWYMTDADGGYTAFPKADLAHYGEHPVIAAQPFDSTCPATLKVPPRRGKVIIFYSLLPNGDGDVTSQHSACPVTSGVKWAANKWVWNGKPYFK